MKKANGREKASNKSSRSLFRIVTRMTRITLRTPGGGTRTFEPSNLRTFEPSNLRTFEPVRYSTGTTTSLKVKYLLVRYYYDRHSNYL